MSVNAGASPLGADYSLLYSPYLRIQVALLDIYYALRPGARFTTCADPLGLLDNRCLLLGREACFRCALADAARVLCERGLVAQQEVPI